MAAVNGEKGAFFFSLFNNFRCMKDVSPAKCKRKTEKDMSFFLTLQWNVMVKDKAVVTRQIQKYFFLDLFYLFRFRLILITCIKLFI